MIISTPADHVVANRVDTGEEVWWLPYNCFSLVARPVHGNGLVYAIGGLRDGHYVMYAIPEDSKGELSATNLAWKREKSVPQCPSPLLMGKKILLMKDSGVATCLDALTGDELWQERMDVSYFKGYRELAIWYLFVVDDATLGQCEENIEVRWVSQGEDLWHPLMQKRILLALEQHVPELMKVGIVVT